MSETDQHPSISVALCTYNGARFVAEQLHSILSQSLPVDEIVISDDGSTDATLERVREVLGESVNDGVESNPKVVIIENGSPLGVTRNFEQASLACTGDLIVLCDQDDVWHADRLERAVREFAHSPELLLVFSDAQLVDEAGEPLPDSLFEAIEFSRAERRAVNAGRGLMTLLRRNVATGATIVFRRELLQRAIPFPGSWVHDEWLAILAAMFGVVNVIGDRLIDYRQHASNEIGAARPTLALRRARLREPRRERNRTLLVRAESLLERVTEYGDELPPNIVELARGKVAHERFRSGLSSSRALRLLPILRMAASGSYRTFGRARHDMLRDLVQPDR